MDRIVYRLLYLSSAEDAQRRLCGFDQQRPGYAPGLGATSATVENFVSGRLVKERELRRDLYPSSRR